MKPDRDIIDSWQLIRNIQKSRLDKADESSVEVGNRPGSSEFPNEAPNLQSCLPAANTSDSKQLRRRSFAKILIACIALFGIFQYLFPVQPYAVLNLVAILVLCGMLFFHTAPRLRQKNEPPENEGEGTCPEA